MLVDAIFDREHLIDRGDRILIESAQLVCLSRQYLLALVNLMGLTGLLEDVIIVLTLSEALARPRLLLILCCFLERDCLDRRILSRESDLSFTRLYLLQGPRIVTC